MEKSVSFKGSNIFYQLINDGSKAVMLIHGFGEDPRIWDGLLPLFAGYKIIIPSLPGIGKSELLDASKDSISLYADALNMITEVENISKLTVIGHSMGGYIAMALAEKHRDKIERLGLFHSTSFADSDEKVETRKKGISFIKEHGPYAFMKTSIPGLFYDETASKESIAMLTERSKDFSAEVLTRFYRAMMGRPNLSHVLSILEVPVLIICGRHDKAVPFEQSLRESHLAELTQFHVLENSAHMGMYEQPEQVKQIISSFLKL